jgi:hypothetical protein
MSLLPTTRVKTPNLVWLRGRGTQSDLAGPRGESLAQSKRRAFLFRPEPDS